MFYLLQHGYTHVRPESHHDHCLKDSVGLFWANLAEEVEQQRLTAPPKELAARGILGKQRCPPQKPGLCSPKGLRTFLRLRSHCLDPNSMQNESLLGSEASRAGLSGCGILDVQVFSVNPDSAPNQAHSLLSGILVMRVWLLGSCHIAIKPQAIYTFSHGYSTA